MCERCGGGNLPSTTYRQWCAAAVPARLVISPREPSSAAAGSTGTAALVATFGPKIGWAGRTIVFENNRLILGGHGHITSGDALVHDRRGHLTCAAEGSRAWVEALVETP